MYMTRIVSWFIGLCGHSVMSLWCFYHWSKCLLCQSLPGYQLHRQANQTSCTCSSLLSPISTLVFAVFVVRLCSCLAVLFPQYLSSLLFLCFFASCSSSDYSLPCRFWIITEFVDWQTSFSPWQSSRCQDLQLFLQDYI